MKQALAICMGLAGILCSSRSLAQTATSPNTEFNRHFDGIAGSFPYALNAQEQVQVMYRLTPAHPADKAQFMLHTPEPMPFHASITNDKGKVVYTWKPEQALYLYNVYWDLSRLPGGTYTINIMYGSDKKAGHQVTFSK